MVRASDLGVPSSNLEKIPSRKERKNLKLEQAIRNLTTVNPPERLTKSNLPAALLTLRSG